ncbi:MAG: hypothetical protein U0935_24105 [Pirellulales bacterium]
MSLHSSWSRRDFAAWLAAAGTAGWATDSRATAAADPAPPPAVPPTAADHALQLLLARFPNERLDAAAQASLRADLERHAVRSAVLAAVELQNGDEPGFTFAAWRRPQS